MRVSDPISLSYFTMVSNNSLKILVSLIPFLEVGGEGKKFEDLSKLGME